MEISGPAKLKFTGSLKVEFEGQQQESLELEGPLTLVLETGGTLKIIPTAGPADDNQSGDGAVEAELKAAVRNASVLEGFPELTDQPADQSNGHGGGGDVGFGSGDDVRRNTPDGRVVFYGDKSVGRHPLEIFPTELWEPILNEVEDEEDLRTILNMADSCAFFSDLVGDRQHSLRLAEIFPLVVPWLGREDLLSCRLIAKPIRKSVDKILDEVWTMSPFKKVDLFQRIPPLLALPSSLSDYGQDRTGFGSGVTIDSAEKLERFHLDMQNTSLASPGGRPFVGKQLSLLLRNPIMDDGEWLNDPDFGIPWHNVFLFQRSLNILPLYSEKITCLHFSSGYGHSDLTEAYELLRELLVALPNLRVISGEFEGHDLSEAEYMGDMVDLLHRHIELSPLPIMPLLEDFSTHDFEMSTPFYKEIVTRYGATLKKLHIFATYDDIRGFDCFPEYLSEELQQFPNLLDLKLHLNWPLRRILVNIQAPSLVSLHLKLTGNFHDIDGSQFVGLVNQFPSLSRLHLNLDVDFGDGPRNRLARRQILAAYLLTRQGNRHPNLKHLTVEGEGSLRLMRLNVYAKLFPLLESIRVDIEDEEGGCNALRDISDKDLRYLFYNDMYRSSLWRSLSNLQKIHLADAYQDVTYTRERYTTLSTLSKQ